ncbi:serine/arginine repetitive matrix protein 2-like [Amyelois transitella]|uniref:serine/arginine repetitive matrix protein 2-like n=1 Tax=Amyelois transitella TaxID=680683 RepID=UPI0029900A6C|nr:serine/arginine repetitive matrix protein 2-like [Amyelois transitella]
MSGGQLVVLDRLGRDVKRYQLPEGLATLGSDPACDIRIMLPSVSAHHATVVVHANQTVVRNVSTGSTLVNGRPVSVAALRHRDTIEIGGRALRWDYSDPTADRPLAPQPALYSRTRTSRSGSPKRNRRGSASAPATARSPTLRLAIEMSHRASMPGQLARQVAIVQPQRRDTQSQVTPARQTSSTKRSRASKNGTELDSSVVEGETSKRKSIARPSPKNTSLQGTTKASQWIESRKSVPRKSSRPHAPLLFTSSPRAQSARKVTPLRTTVLRRAQSASKRVTKIEAPLTIDHTKQAAILLMTRHTPKKPGSPQPSHVVRKRSPRCAPRAGTASHTPQQRESSAMTSSPGNVSAAPAQTSGRQPGSVARTSAVTSSATPGRTSRGRKSKAQSVTTDATLVDVSDSNPACSPPLPSPKKSALKDPAAKKSTRKTESIKFDLSNLENLDDQSGDVFFVSDVTKDADDSQSEGDMTLHYESSVKSPSPRKSIHSRSSRILERTLGTTLSEPRAICSTLTAESPRPRKSSRVSVIVQKALETPGNSRYSQRTTKSLSDESYDTTVASAFQTRTLSPRSPSQNLESYSIVDLVSVDSNRSENSSIYNSMRTTKSSDSFGTPQNSIGRKTRSTIDPSLLTSSTPYVAKTTRGSKRSLSSANISQNSKTSQISRGSSRRSKSWSTPENTQKHISVNSTRVSRASRSRSRLNDSDLLLISTVSDDESSPKSSKRASRATNSVSLEKSSVISPKTIITGTRKSKSLSSSKSLNVSPNSKISPATRKTKSLSSPRSLSSPVINISAVTRKTKSLSRPKSLQSSPKTNVSTTRKSRTTLSPKSPINSPKDNTGNQRKTRSNLSLSISNVTNEGICTPENRQSPVEEVCTPVLSIQNLLDSTQSSLTSLRSSKQGRGSLKPPKPKKDRKSLKSKSFNFGARNTASRLSKESNSDRNEGSNSMIVEDVVTPKSAVKLVQEAVKNKHSTAKKPLSKRSIIDDLNESDFVKQLFNSPVKRKLSQSMTEFSRKQLFDDDDVPKRPTRHTVALGQTPDNSILNETGSYTPEVFVSPLGTPNNSPNLTGIKRLFKKQTPDNDLRNVKGVKGLLRTPRTRRSIKNDLTRVSGVKNVFARSPKNRLSDVRVKEVFAASPKNDLRRVTGVKSLFQTQKKAKSPKNDLRDVRGVKKLFGASSPANDLRNVSGVKKVLRKNSPRNDLSDVRGVKAMFRQEKEQNDINVSGVEELFNESTHSYRDSELLFDRLIGRPPIKAVYSRTFIKKNEKPRKRRRSLHVSIDEIIEKPEEWLQKELQKCLEKKRARELQKLATSTVEGNAPLCTSRARNSTLTQSEENVSRKRSTAENYSSHTLPIKKRSLASRDSSRVSRGSSASGIDAMGRVLPLKKRALVHSTPLKGRARAPAALGRVSPIARADHSASFTTTVVEVPVLQTSECDTKVKGVTSVTKIVVSPKRTRGKVRGKASVVVSPKTAPVVVSPKKTIVLSPKVTRMSAKNDSGVKKRATLVVAKKAPVMSPKPAANVQEKSPSPKKRTTRRQKNTETESVDIQKPKSPKRTRGKRVSLVVSKPSPKMKPRVTKAQAALSQKETSAGQSEVPNKQRRTRKTTAPTEVVDKKTESPKGRTTRHRKNTDVEVTKPATKSKSPKTNKTESVEEKPTKTRGKKAVIETNKGSGKKSDAVEKTVPAKRGRKTETVETPAPKKAKDSEEQKPVATRRGRNTVGKVESPKRGRKTQDVEAKKGRGAKVEANKSVSSKRGRKIDTKEEKTLTRGRKTDAQEVKVAQKEVKVAQKDVKVAQKRGKKADKSEQSNISASPVRRRGKVSEAQEKKTRGKKADAETEVKPNRASKAEANRKRKSTAEVEVPSKVRKTRAGGVADAKAQAGSGAARGKQSVAETAPATRKRKTADTPAKPAKESGKRAKRVVAKPASPVKRSARSKAITETKKSTRGKR